MGFPPLWRDTNRELSRQKAWNSPSSAFPFPPNTSSPDPPPPILRQRSRATPSRCFWWRRTFYTLPVPPHSAVALPTARSRTRHFLPSETEKVRLSTFSGGACFLPLSCSPPSFLEAPPLPQPPRLQSLYFFPLPKRTLSPPSAPLGAYFCSRYEKSVVVEHKTRFSLFAILTEVRV